MNFERVAEMLSELRVLQYFPGDEHAILALARLCSAMASNESQVRWLVTRMTSGLYAEWPGPQEMRACFCSRFKPKDGINAYSTVYLDGMPAERPALPPSKLRELPPGDSRSQDDPADPRTAAAINIAAETIKFRNASISGPATKAEIAAAPEWLRRLEGYIE